MNSSLVTMVETSVKNCMRTQLHDYLVNLDKNVSGLPSSLKQPAKDSCERIKKIRGDLIERTVNLLFVFQQTTVAASVINVFNTPNLITQKQPPDQYTSGELPVRNNCPTSESGDLNILVFNQDCASQVSVGGIGQNVLRNLAN